MQQAEIVPERSLPTSLDYLGRVYEHVRWADTHARDALRAAGSGHDRAREIYAHILAAEHVWLSRLLGEAPQHPVWPALDLDACNTLAQQNNAAYASYLARLTPAALEHVVAYRNSAGTAFESKVADVLYHVALHGAYHRGQVALLLRGAGAEPSATDYIAFVRGSPAATRV